MKNYSIDSFTNGVKKLFSNCVATLNRIDRSFRRDFLCTMSQDYRLFKEKGWIDFALY